MDDMLDKYHHMNINQNYKDENQSGKRNKTEFIDHTPPDPEGQQNQSPDSPVIIQKTKKDDIEMITEAEDDQWKLDMKIAMEGEFGRLTFKKNMPFTGKWFK